MKEYIHQTQIDQNITSRIPGYLLVESYQDDLKSIRIIEEGIKRFFGGFGEFAHLIDLGLFKFALLMPEFLPQMNCVSLYKNENDFAFIEGTFYDYQLLLRNKKKNISTDLASEILIFARNQEYNKLKEYNGRYSGFVYLKETKKLIVITDSYGANRVFVFNDSSAFAVSNNIFALSTNPALNVNINEESIAQILHYEYPAYRQTEFKEIELVLPSDILIRENKYNKVLKSFQKVDRTLTKSDKHYIDDLRQNIDQFFKDTTNYLKEPIGLYLSKGKDCRLFLPFLERNSIPYIPFVFKEDTGIFDYPYVKEIATLLDKDLHVLEHHKIERNFSFLFSMSTTPTSPWLALGKVAVNYVSNALMGLYGESSSGKLCAYRNYGVVDQESSIKHTILGNSKGISREETIKWLPYYKKWDTELGFRKIYTDYPKVQIPFDYDTYQDIDHRSFRNANVVLLKSQHFITPITPYMEKNVANAYHHLPHSLLKSQIAHTIIAAEEQKSNKVRSTAFPVSLKYEAKLRSLLIELVKFNSKYKDILLKQHKKNYKPFIKKESFIPKSEYFKNIFTSREPVFIGNPRILTRIYNVDDYLHMTLEQNLAPFFKEPVVITNEIDKIKSGTNSSVTN